MLLKGSKTQKKSPKGHMLIQSTRCSHRLQKAGGLGGEVLSDGHRGRAKKDDCRGVSMGRRIDRGESQRTRRILCQATGQGMIKWILIK